MPSYLKGKQKTMATSTVTPDQDAPQQPAYTRTVQYPSGHVVAFPDSLSAQEFSDAAKRSWDFLKNEVRGAGQTIMGLPSAIADSVTVQPNADEQQSLGVPANPTLPQKAALALYRNLGEPIQNAAQWYGTLVRHHQNIIDFIPSDILAQGLGAGGAAAVLGKVLAPSEEVTAQPKPVVSAEPTVKSVQAPVAEVVSPERRGVARPPLLNAAELEEAIRNRRPVRTPFDSTEGAQATIDADIRQRLDEAPSGRNARRAEPVQTVIPGTGVEEVKPEVPDTRPDVSTFYSKAERVAQQKVPSTASGDQILATLRNNGVKENEIGWMGLDDFLKGKPKVSKADLQQFINENQIQLGESNRPANGSDSASLNTEKNTIHDYLDAVRGRNADSPLGKALDAWLKDEGPESTSKLLSHPDVTPELASQISRYDQLDEQLKNAPENPAKYSKYVLDGPKENYNEKLLTLPEKVEPISKFPEGMKVIKTSTGEYWVADEDGYDVTRNEYGDQHTFATPEEARDAALEAMNSGPFAKKYRGLSSQSFKSPHFEEPNVLAHVRHDDRIDTDGMKNLFLEEVQSDWHQAGKQEGYREGNLSELDKRRQEIENKGKDATPAEKAEWADIKNKIQTHAKGVPDAPFKSDWHELAMKRMLREAAEKGYDRLSWTTGDQQVDRYDLSHHIGRVQYDPDANELTAYDPHGHQVIEEKVDPDVDELARYIGKEPAQKLADQIDNYEPRPSDDSLWEMYSQDYRIKEIPDEEDEDAEPRYGVFNEGYGREAEETFDSERAAEEYIHDQVRFNVENYEHDGSELPEISGLDLKVGGEWAHALYDRAIPNFMNKYLKKWGGKVGTTYIPVGEGEKGGLNYHLIAPNGELYDAFRTRQQAEDALKSVAQPGSATRWHIQDNSPDDEAVHSIDITPAMRKSLMKEGQPISRNVTPPAFDWAKTAREALAGEREAA